MLDKGDSSSTTFSTDFSTEFSSMSFASNEFSAPWASTEKRHGGLVRRTLDSFKRDPNITISRKGIFGADGRVFDAEQAAQGTANTALMRRLKGRHLQMIAFGGSIGWWMSFARFRNEWNVDCRYRDWPLRRIREITAAWRTRVSAHSVLPDRHNALLHGSCSG